MDKPIWDRSFSSNLPAYLAEGFSSIQWEGQTETETAIQNLLMTDNETWNASINFQSPSSINFHNSANILESLCQATSLPLIPSISVAQSAVTPNSPQPSTSTTSSLFSGATQINCDQRARPKYVINEEHLKNLSDSSSDEEEEEDDDDEDDEGEEEGGEEERGNNNEDKKNDGNDSDCEEVEVVQMANSSQIHNGQKTFSVSNPLSTTTTNIGTTVVASSSGMTESVATKVIPSTKTQTSRKSRSKTRSVSPKGSRKGTRSSSSSVSDSERNRDDSKKSRRSSRSYSRSRSRSSSSSSSSSSASYYSTASNGSGCDGYCSDTDCEARKRKQKKKKSKKGRKHRKEADDREVRRREKKEKERKNTKRNKKGN